MRRCETELVGQGKNVEEAGRAAESRPSAAEEIPRKAEAGFKVPGGRIRGYGAVGPDRAAGGGLARQFCSDVIC